MMKKIVPAVLASAAFLTSGVALADHNSPFGEGWANMPNDVHNTRLDTRDDNDAFVSFVRGGGGADSVNRFSTDTTVVSGGGMGGAMGAGGGMRGAMGAGGGAGRGR